LGYDIRKKEDEIEIKKAAIIGFLRELQEKAKENTLTIFLRNKSLAESIFEKQSINNLSVALASEVTKLRDVKIELAGKLENTEQNKSLIEQETKNLKYRKEITEDKKGERKTLLSDTKNQERIYQSQLKELEKKQSEIGEAIEDIESQLRASFDPNLLPIKRPGVLLDPLKGAGIRTQEYGNTNFARKAYSTKFHNGVDFGASYSTPIYSARAGKITAVGNNGRYQYGRYVLIEHDNGLTSLYAHMARSVVTTGSNVEAGQLIGYVGSTGYSYGNHLHLGLYWSTSVLLKDFPKCNCGLVPVGVTIDPDDYL
jgi:murein DD-endopeptidase MepM/ murein hydrolase activator NlpD